MSGEWVANFDPDGVWQMIPVDRLVAGDRLWPDGEPVGARLHKRDGVSLSLRVEIWVGGQVRSWPGDDLVRIYTRDVDPNRLHAWLSAVRRAGVPEEAVEGVARALLARGVPLGQVHVAVVAGAF